MSTCQDFSTPLLEKRLDGLLPLANSVFEKRQEGKDPLASASWMLASLTNGQYSRLASWIFWFPASRNPTPTRTDKWISAWPSSILEGSPDVSGLAPVNPRIHSVWAHHATVG